MNPRFVALTAIAITAMGGDIVTVNDAQLSAESVAVKDGKTVYSRTP